MKLRNIRIMMASALVCMLSAMVSAAEWDMCFGRDWTWEYLMQRRASDDYRTTMYMHFTGGSFSLDGKIYHEFACFKTIRLPYPSDDSIAPVVDETPDSDSKYVRQEGDQVFVLCEVRKQIDQTIYYPVSDPENYNSEDLAESLIYDFSPKVGDPLGCDNIAVGGTFLHTGFIVESVETIPIAGRECRSIFFKDLPSPFIDNFKMIESIGVTYGGTLAYFTFDCILGGAYGTGYALFTILLSVVDENGEQVFQHPNYNEYVKAMIDDVATDNDNQPICYYNLQGQPVANPVHGEIYILRDSSGSRKVVY